MHATLPTLWVTHHALRIMGCVLERDVFITGCTAAATALFMRCKFAATTAAGRIAAGADEFHRLRGDFERCAGVAVAVCPGAGVFDFTHYKNLASFAEEL